MTTQIAVRLPDQVLESLDRLVPEMHASRSEAIRRAIELYIYQAMSERDASIYEANPLSDAELALSDSTDSWVSTPQW